MVEKIYKEVTLYPIDYPFKTLFDNVEEGQLILNPSFQRKYKWDKEGFAKPSKFIESCLMRIPLPVCYFSETDQGDYLVIDGVQRLTTIRDFFKDKFALEDLLVFDELNGKKFSELDRVYQKDLENYTMRCILLRRDNPKYILNDIFARLNQGGVQLTHQEIRNAIYPGVLNDLLKELKGNTLIKNFGGPDKESLGDEELILRFFAMRGSLDDYDDKIHKYLDIYMAKNQNIDLPGRTELKDLFLSTLKKCEIIFGENVFVNPLSKKKKQSIVFYDLLMVSFQHISLEKLKKNKKEIVNAFKTMCENEAFTKTLTGGLGQKSQILKRRKIWSNYLKDIELVE